MRAVNAWCARPINSVRPVIEVKNLSKHYALSGSQFARFRGLFGREPRADEGLWALRDVSFTVAPGEAFGIIGANGSGKSTLLQIIAGILRPTSGTVRVDGRLSALLELGSGFSHEFTGRDNVYLNASLLGLTKDEIDARFETIAKFAEIGDFIDQPVKTYSTGMVLRLAFAVTAHVDPQVLIVDEALAVGDIAFRQRCMRRIHDLRARGTTILFVSHESSDVKALCERCVWLEKGVVQALGESDEVVARYLAATARREMGVRPVATEALPEPTHSSIAGGHRFGDGRVSLVSAGFGKSGLEFYPLERLVLRVVFQVNSPVPSLLGGFLVRNSKGENMFGSNTARENYPIPALVAGEIRTLDFHWVLPEMVPGEYSISLAMADGNVEAYEFCDYAEDVVKFAVLPAADGTVHGRGYFALRCSEVVVHRH